MKDLRQSQARASRNKQAKENIAYLLKRVQKSVEANDLTKAEEYVKQAVKAIDRAVQKGVMKKNTGARKKSRLIKSAKPQAKK
ncbi:MAG: 30S ribosomal protein S20 [Candidatus Buchananbacteria bacterium CG10_big_fil_rev_8_21_14_0_10_42_9]|uniref:Small ribosomal subunit protein bS20 n=1 Tax=Candidatus Buchananbacteria bacterium CG10_big_fil_rev_8_21_14_0_10_42_9 TaxID=1974526 RepID=A0A2H0W0G2_9BACT|nr:MAG: 30S ribosomal protein S20 [Candidatus Buchananbacteria bacterium CG10_big_fil_rev_8_21_14_0_10_42_9]